jgi:hypothetical protein
MQHIHKIYEKLNLKALELERVAHACDPSTSLEAETGGLHAASLSLAWLLSERDLSSNKTKQTSLGGYLDVKDTSEAGETPPTAGCPTALLMLGLPPRCKLEPKRHFKLLIDRSHCSSSCPELTMYTRLASNIQRSAYLFLQSAGIKSVPHHTFFFFSSHTFFFN